MSIRRIAVGLVCLLCGLIVVPEVWSAVISGTIESVSADRKKITIKPSGDKPKQVYSIPDGTSITLDGRSAKLGDLKEGQQVSVFTSSGDAVTRLTVRGAESKPTAPATTPTPKATPKSKKTDSADSPNDNASDNKPGDSPQFRGPARDGRAGSGNNIANSWPSSGPKPAWSANGLGAGFSAVSVANGRVFTMGLIGNDEKVFAMNERDGRAAWAVSTGGGAYKDGTGDGPRCTPTVDGDRLYALGALGDLVCLDAKSGQRRWHKNMLKEFGGNAGHWGICESPLIDGERVIVTPGGRGATLVALNKNNGNLIWKSRTPGDPGPGYASAITVEVGGVRQYVNFTSRGLVGVRAEDGEFLWQNGSAANGTANCSAAVFHDNHVFYGSGYGTGGACLRLASNGNTTRAEEVYKTNNMKNHHGGMVVVDGFLYGCDENILTCLDLLSGKVLWKDRSPGKGSITFADGLLIVRNEDGPVTLVEANSQRYVEKGQFDQPHRSRRQAWAYPVVANGHLLLRDQETLLCYDLRR
ncbi:MAG: PQQ-binding-like beta-propeller repeat protein [Planctomycetaceae bacterium]